MVLRSHHLLTSAHYYHMINTSLLYAKQTQCGKYYDMIRQRLFPLSHGQWMHSWVLISHGAFCIKQVLTGYASKHITASAGLYELSMQDDSTNGNSAVNPVMPKT